MLRQYRHPLQTLLAALAVIGALYSLSWSDASLPTTENFFTWLICVVVVAVCTRFPILVRQTEFNLSHAISIGLLLSFGVAPAALVTGFGLLIGEAWWALAPGQAPAADRPARVSTATAQFVRQIVPVLAAGAADRLIARQLTTHAPSETTVALAIFTIINVVLYLVTLLLEVDTAPGAATRFFRENLGTVGLALSAPLPLVVIRALQIAEFEGSLVRVMGGILLVLTLWLYWASWRILHQTQALAASQETLTQAREQVDQAQRQATLMAARAEVAARNSRTLVERARQFDTLVQLNETLRAFAGAQLPYESILRQIAEATEATLAQLGLLSSTGNSIQYVANLGLSDTAIQQLNAIASAEAGLPGRALRSGHAERVNNVLADPDYVEQFPGVRSEMAVPLMQGDRRVGVIRLLSRQANAFTTEAEAFAAQAANLVALAVTNASLKEQAQTRQKEHSILFEAGSQLTANLDLRTVQGMVVQKLAEAMDADLCTLAEVDPTARTFRLIEPYAPHAQQVAEHGAVSAAITDRRAVVVQANDTRADVRELEALRAEGMSTVVVLPMVNANQVTGFARLYTRDPRQYTPPNLQLLHTLANQAATALHNARTYQQVIESRDRLAAILNSTREGVLVIDSTGIISLVNPRIEELWGVSVGRLLNQHLTQLLAAPDLDLAGKLGFQDSDLEELLLTLRAGLALSISKAHYQIQQPKLRYLERTGAPVLDQFARAIGWVIILRDMTEERELQQVRDTLSNMIVHDLRSPLASMLAGLHLIRDRVPPEQQTPIIRQSVEIAIRSCNKMIGLVNTLLDISRLETGELSLARRPVQLTTLVDEVLDDLTPLANDQGLVLISDVASALPSLQADADKLNRVFTNLIDNALKFSPPGGQVTVRAELQPASNGHGQPRVMCSVLDNGPGIPDDYRERIFDRFVQVQGRKGRREGTGLGLAFCKLAVEAHGGRIWAENRPEGGTAINFTLPLEQTEAAT